MNRVINFLASLHERAPREVLWARATVPVIMLFVYVAFRAYPMADGRIPLGEVLSVGAIILGLSVLALTAFAELVLRERTGPQLAEPSAEETTAVLPTPMPRTPVMMLDDEDRARIHSKPILGGLTAAARDIEELNRLVDHGRLTGALTHPDVLLTHEHTPARGLDLGAISAALDGGPRPTLPGRHRRVEAANQMLDRERTGQLFGEL